MDLDLFKVLKIIYINSVIHFTKILFYCYQAETEKSQKKPSPFYVDSYWVRVFPSINLKKKSGQSLSPIASLH